MIHTTQSTPILHPHVCVWFCSNFSTFVDLCYQNHNQNTELSHHYKDLPHIILSLYIFERFFFFLDIQFQVDSGLYVYVSLCVFYYLKMFHFLLASIFSVEKSAIILLIPLCPMFLAPISFLDFVFIFGVQNFTVICLCVISSDLMLFKVYSASQICELLFLIQFGKLPSQHFFKYFFALYSCLILGLQFHTYQAI